MENPYLKLHGDFRTAGADVLLSSGQACVVFGVAAFSKDGDWIVRENCPYLSEDQRELSTLDFKGRSEWMGEWLMLAASAKASRSVRTLPRRRFVHSWS